MIAGIAHVCFNVRSLDASLAFYRDRLGLAEAFPFLREDGSKCGVYLHVGGRNFIELFEGEVGEAAVRSLLPEPVRARARHGALDSVFVLNYGADADVPAIIKRLAAEPEVAYAEPNGICRVLTTPDDPHYSATGSWGQPYADMWGLHTIGLVPVGTGSGWDYETGHTTPIVVAVIDTGIDSTHQDIGGQIWVNAEEIADNDIDDDENGYVDDVTGWDFAYDDNLPDDRHGHGTHCAGTIAAATDNGIGVAGISWGASIMAVKGLGDGGSAPSTSLADAIVYAADNGARVLSNSWSGASTFHQQVLEDACAHATDSGCLVLAAAGNDATDLFPPHPASYPEVMAVAATDRYDVKAWFSNFGPFVEIAAPGIDVLSLRAFDTDMYGDGAHIVGTDYYRSSGTSMACPHVAGVAALVWSMHPEWTADQVREQLRRTADDIEPLNPNYVGDLGSGRVNARHALALTPRPLVRLRDVAVEDAGSASPNQALDFGEVAGLLVSLRNSWLTAADVTVALTTTDPFVTVNDGAADYGPIAEGEIKTNLGDPLTVSVSPACPFGHVVAFDIQIDADGHAWAEQFTLTVASPQLSAYGCIVLDIEGDQDGDFDPGETCSLVVRLANGPHAAPARNVMATAAAADPYLSIGSASATYADIGPGEAGLNAGQPFEVTLDPAFPPDHVGVIEIGVTADGFAAVLEVEVALSGVHREISDVAPMYSYDPYSLNVRIDNQDRIHVGWSQPDEERGGYFTAYRQWIGGQWLDREYITDGYIIADMADMDIDPQGRPHFSWFEAIVVPDIFPLVARGIYYRGRDDGWGPVDNICNTPGEVENVVTKALAVDDAGTAHIAWWFIDYDQGAFVDQTLYHRMRVDGVWQPPLPVEVRTQSAWFGDIKLLSAPPGRLWLLYRFNSYNTVLLCRTWDGASWSAQQQVPTGGLPVSDFDADVDSAGDLHVLFRSQESEPRMFHVAHAGGVWSGLTQVPGVPGATGEYNPRVYADRDDVIHLLWEVGTHPGDYTIENIYTWRYAQGSWSALEQLTDFPTTESFRIGDLAMVKDRSGRRHVFYVGSYKGVFHFMPDSAGLTTSPDGLLAPGWNLVSLPREPIDGDPAAAFAGLNIDSRLYRYIPGVGYRAYISAHPADFGGEVRQGEGYWLYVDSAGTIAYRGLPQEETQTVDLSPPGWLLIGHPRDVATSLFDCDVYVLPSGTPISLAAADAQHWLDAPFYWFDPGAGSYSLIGFDPWQTPSFGPWRGCWIWVNQPDLRMLVPAP